MESRILILCTGNSARSQMAEGFLKSFDPQLEVFSAGTDPATRVHPKAVEVMMELNIDISSYSTKDVQKFLGQPFDFVVTVCDNARETCPVFNGKVKHRMHMGFEDPAKLTGSDEEILLGFRRIRDQIKKSFEDFYNNILTNS
ncbi:MAG: arsenate reductase ArsC [Bacteroidota bacterium]